MDALRNLLFAALPITIEDFSQRLLQELRRQVLSFRQVSALRFFEPTVKFWHTIERFRDRPIIDLGCGRGDLVQELHQRKFRVSGYDISMPLKPDPKLHCYDATIFPFRPLMVGLICRPCHDGWSYETLKRGLSQGATMCYIGLWRNVEDDLDDLIDSPLLDHIVTGIGRDGEAAWIFNPIM